MASAETLAVVRRAVRRVIEGAPELEKSPTLKRDMAERMVRVSMMAAELIDEERRANERIHATSAPSRVPLAAGQAAGDIHRRTATSAAAGTLRATRDAIDFPGFVTSLISGVFQSISQSSIQQLQAVADLLQAVDTSVGQFADSQIDEGRGRAWLAGQFGALAVDRSTGKLTLRDGAELPRVEEVRRALGASSEELSSIDEDDLDALLPLARRKLARDRQSMLATMVLMGLRRVVVDDGRIRASMELQVDARSTAEQTEASQTDARVSTSAQGSFGVGAWGASASVSATVGYVKSDQQYSREDLAVRAGLRSMVEVGFHTEPFDMRRMAPGGQLERVRQRSMVPEAEPPLQSLLTGSERQTQAPQFAAPPAPPAPPPLPPPRENNPPQGGGGQGGGGQGGGGQGSGGQGGGQGAGGQGGGGQGGGGGGQPANQGSTP